MSDRLGGHLVSGNVDGLGPVKNIEKLEKSWLLSMKWTNNKFSKDVVNKGSICVNGISLTIAKYKREGEIFLQNFVFTLIYFRSFSTINKLKSK